MSEKEKVTVKQLKEWLEDKPDNCIVFGYEGIEGIAIIVQNPDDIEESWSINTPQN